MTRASPLFLALALLAAPAAADEFTDVVEGALEAYRAGDVSVAQEDLEYAMQLLNGMKSELLAKHLPPALPGWTRQESSQEDAAGASMAMSMFGGGTAAAATYTKGSDTLTLSLIAGEGLASGIGAMITGMAGMGGKPIRVQRVQFTETDGELHGVVDGKVMVALSGNASLEDKTAYLEAMDLEALADF